MVLKIYAIIAQYFNLNKIIYEVMNQDFMLLKKTKANKELINTLFGP